ncbi:hypothetical protein [Nocardioides panaciterrulae]|uniref:Uncharacterized protein n=1 Tax=Nocardioides panaciterrulae TaxID=661492 RepID=A0A7Y9E3I5_9ACTN|nr:hypothetical protein [Nocardioides panaciterrulae]NYD40380.1 hypothetical protein [Nocardioides panaciterrulae]
MDGLVAFWFVLWLLVGAWSGYTMWQLSGLGDTVTSSGQAIGSAGQALRAVGKVPVVGERPGELGRQVVATGADVADRGQQVKSELRQLSLLLGLAIALAPTTPIAGLYLPLRLARRRETIELRQALVRHGDDPGLERYLAERALHSLSYAEAHRLHEDPVLAVAEGNTRPLADAELARLGLTRSQARS